MEIVDIAPMIEQPTWYHVWFAFAVTAGGYLIAAIYVPRVLLKKTEPGATLAWIIIILLFPYIGFILYTLLGNKRVQRNRKAKQRADRLIERDLFPLRRERAWAEALEMPQGADPSLLNVGRNLGLSPPTFGNALQLYTEGPAAFTAIERAIDEAKHHVHAEFFIFRSDGTGKRIRDALMRAARRGVQVRLLLDSVGGYMTLTSKHFFDPLGRAGGKIGWFLPVGLFRGWSVFNLRNHRKLLVVDGGAAFTGGMNVGDEYAGASDRSESWRDTLVHVRGPAAEQFQEVFVGDWYFATAESLADPIYFPKIRKAGEDCVQVVASGPDDSLARLHRLTLAMIDSAREQLYITTPYFVPDPALASALVLAALRGVDVRLLVPRRSNHLLVHWAGRSFFEELLQAGVTIHEYARGMLHAKALSVDGTHAAVGSANMDVRSFRLNFELNTFVYGPGFASQIEEEFVRDTLSSERIVPSSFLSRNPAVRFAETMARILGPVL